MAATVSEVALMQFLYASEMRDSRRFHADWRRRDAVFVAFAFAHDDGVGAEINILAP